MQAHCRAFQQHAKAASGHFPELVSYYIGARQSTLASGRVEKTLFIIYLVKDNLK